MIRKALKKLLFRFGIPVSKKPAIPAGHTHQSLFNLLGEFHIDGIESAEIANYLAQDFLRFVHTLNLAPDGKGKLLEIGSNPYFTSMLIKKFTAHDLACTNYFGGDLTPASQQMRNLKTGETLKFDYLNHNIEDSDLPFAEKFDAILFCEVLEHMTMDPLLVLTRIKKALKPDGHLILSTPNVNRLENVARMLAGANIYDPYSGYGPYGRHNREYNRHELVQLLTHAGFDVEVIFSADVHDNTANHYFSLLKIVPLVLFRRNDLGQYLFLRAKNAKPAGTRKPGWLYRSYPPDQLE